MARLELPRVTPRRSSALSLSPWVWGSAVLVLLVGAVLRIIEISRYPPGFHYDESVNFIIAREIAHYGARPFPVFAAFNGREVFHFYVEALAMLGIGQHIFTLHFVNIMMNMLTLATTIGLGSAMFGRPRGVILGVLAGGMMAVSFPQIWIARQSFRAVSLPMLQALCLWTLFIGLSRPLASRRKWPWLVAAGILGAAALYTYMASRLFPGWVALILGMLWIFDKDHRRQRFVQAAVVMLVLLVVALPIINYYRENQDVFSDRLSQLSATEGAPSYTESAWLHFKMFFIRGDPFIRYNEPFAAYFDPLTGALLLVGLGVSLWQVFHAASPVARAAYFIVACAPLMVVPSVLAVGGLPPSHMRSIAMVPLIFFLPAIGVNTVWNWLPQPRSLSNKSRLPALAAWVILAGMAVWVWGRYERWASNPELFYLDDGDMVAAGDWLEAHTDSQTLMYVTSLHYDHPSMRMHELPGANITFLLGGRLFLPPPNRDAYLIETHNAPLSADLRQMAEEYFERSDGTKDPAGAPSFTIYQWSPTSPSPDTRLTERVSETIGGWLAMVETNAPEGVAGQSVTITSQWLILNTPAYADLTPIFQLETPYGDVLARQDPFTQYSNLWRSGEILIQQAQFDIPIGTPPGEYPVTVSWVGRTANQYVARLDAQGHFAGIETELMMLTIGQPEVFPSAAALSIPHATSIEFAAGVRLLGWSDFARSVRPGEGLKLDLYWQALASERTNETLHFLAVPAEGEALTLWEGAPVMNSYAFSEWVDGELVIDRHRWALPLDLPAGNYALVLQVGSEEIALGEFSVAELNRQFEAPQISHATDVQLGDMVRLVGYDLSAETLAPGQEYQLTLFWQSLATTDLPLTVFVHVVDANNVSVDQRDWQPRQNAYPVALWVPGEYVDDVYALKIPDDALPGTYQIRVGMYLQASGQTLTRTENGNTLDDSWALTEIIVQKREN